MRTFMPAFDRHKDQADLIGRIVTGYGDLEFGLAHCVSRALDDPDRVFKAMFKERGEMKRIKIACDLGHAAPMSSSWMTEFDNVVDGMHHCREIRNQYAHCNWLDNLQNGLSFVQLEEIAKSTAVIDLGDLTQHVADLPLLQDQVDYFAYVDRLTSYVNYEAQFANGKLRANHFDKPAARGKPPLRVVAPVPTPLAPFRKKP